MINCSIRPSLTDFLKTVKRWNLAMFCAENVVVPSSVRVQPYTACLQRHQWYEHDPLLWNNDHQETNWTTHRDSTIPPPHHRKKNSDAT